LNSEQNKKKHFRIFFVFFLQTVFCLPFRRGRLKKRQKLACVFDVSKKTESHKTFKNKKKTETLLFFLPNGRNIFFFSPFFVLDTLEIDFLDEDNFF
jgi:hypothetical protein